MFICSKLTHGCEHENVMPILNFFLLFVYSIRIQKTIPYKPLSIIEKKKIFYFSAINFINTLFETNAINEMWA